MARYRIVCTRQVPSGKPRRNSIIVGIGTGKKPGKPDTLWTVDEVLMAMAHGHKFYTKGPKSKKEAKVVSFKCGVKNCRKRHLKAKGDRANDTTLNSLPRFDTL